ncbi:endomembrane protein 70, putative [Trichomonas vaginalis G3]|uniref:Transmembrane 9 superfamily member n=1 Tax=Trichomonas vaginalis (strain ATCC PRA-98 / G3) TaxID=412133 RepID=A2DGZ7_TRIV3|nr:positive regulation of protein exit from endoplasmic reticulum [Trichomonas vaginalis G3]EAY20307.1 endomembrane protein 70, putative [Trichomonas vaginalis G3]KAI5530709.1 positive regulation of protein exit from endoplasmic reticulum [Trichomonas vaginalis G3]|eukprot:XP_001581293.1 endomembrane protein 70 [Trichomonas vaginalis G3]
MFSPRSSIPLNPNDYILICDAKINELKNRKLGEIITGGRIGYIDHNVSCSDHKPVTLTCKKQISEQDFNKITKALENEYRLSFSVAGFPVASYSHNEFRYRGIPFGYKDGPDVLLRTKYIFNVACETKHPGHAMQFDSLTETDSYQIIKPGSTANFQFVISSKTADTGLSSLNRDPDYAISKRNSRLYLLLSFLITAVTLGSSIYIYIQNRVSDSDNTHTLEMDLESETNFEEIGWRLLHGDIFRSPPHPILLSSFVGVGFDILLTVFFVFVCSGLGFFEIVSFSTFVEPFILIFFLITPISGFLSTKLFKTISRQYWKRNLLTSGLLATGFFCSLYLILQIKFMGNKSPASVPIKYILKVSFMLMIGCFFFHFFGSVPALKGTPFEFPTAINQLPRHIPQQPFTSSMFMMMLCGGVQPFIIIALDFHLILESLWTGLSFFDCWGHASISVILALFTSVGVSILSVYISVSNEDYRWWWRAFMTPAASGLFLFGYSMFYVLFTVRPLFGGLIPYLIQSAMMAFVASLAMGCAGFIGSFIFICALYKALKME